MLRSTLIFLLFCGSTAIFAEERTLSAGEALPICHGYGCVAQADIRYSEAQLDALRQQLFSAVDAAAERKMLALVLGQLYRWAGEQSAIHNDKGGNYADAHAPGKMDCLDHSTSTTRLLKMLENRGYLRWHRVLAPEPRYLLGLIASHWSAVIEEMTEEVTEKMRDVERGEAARFVVDSWFVDNGEPAVILPLADWKKGAGPDV